MNTEDITLGKIAVTDFLFNSLTRYNTSLVTFRQDTDHKLDLASEGHRDLLLVWLNAWGCRHLSKDSHGVASRNILEWYQRYRTTLFSDETPLWHLADQEIKAAADAYGSLKNRLGARRPRHGNQMKVPIGPTAASKILFALRPKALMPWDDAMRKAYDCDGSPESYGRYQKTMRSIALHIEKLCKSRGFEIDDLPAKIGRSRSTVVELLNEYIWVTTRKPAIKLPASDTLAQWASLD